MCVAGESPLATHLGRGHQTGHGQMQQCRDMDGLVSWANDPVQHACCRPVNEYADAKHNLERFYFCSARTIPCPALL